MYRWVDHTAELELHVEAATEEDVFAEALAALAELLSEHPDEVPSPERVGGGRAAARGEAGAARHEVTASAPDRPTLLAEWLSELVFLADTEGFVPERMERIELGETDVEATVSGGRGNPSPLVKAVTYHRLEMEEEDGTWRARVVLDV